MENKNYRSENPRARASKVVHYPPVYQHTVPGQTLKPSELLKRHLAGTLPPIDLAKKYEFHYDEEGKQVAEPLPLELHEVHKLAVALRKRHYEEALEQRKKQAERFKTQIIEEYEKQLEETRKKTVSSDIPPKGETAL